MNLQSDHPQAMLTELYIEALLVDEELGIFLDQYLGSVAAP